MRAIVIYIFSKSENALFTDEDTENYVNWRKSLW